MQLGHSFGRASGFSSADAWAIGYRFEAEVGFRPEAGESWLLQTLKADGTNVSMRSALVKAGWYVGVWYSEANRVYVADAAGFIQHGPAAAGQEWAVHRVPAVLTGIWGLDDEHVYAWGENRDGAFVLRWDGRAWSPMPAPEQPIVGLHGVREDLLFGVGDRGFVARFDGHRWQTMPGPDTANLSCAFAVSDQEVYASGHSGSLWQGSVHGWTELLRHDKPLPSVAKWQGDVWVGAYGDFGLCKLDGRKLESLKPNIQAQCLDARRDLVYVTSGKLGSTADGKAFWSSGLALVERVIGPRPPTW